MKKMQLWIPIAAAFLILAAAIVFGDWLPAWLRTALRIAAYLPVLVSFLSLYRRALDREGASRERQTPVVRGGQRPREEGHAA